MGEREVFDAEAAERRWWERWWAEDYSWEGLGKRDFDGVPRKPWHGWIVVEATTGEYCVPKGEAPDRTRTREASLQDYWLADPSDGWKLRNEEILRSKNEIVKEHNTNQLWHIVHLPPRDLRKNLGNWKSNRSGGHWSLLQSIIKTRVRASQEFNLKSYDQLTFPDRRAQFSGCLINGFDTSASRPGDINIKANSSAHLIDVSYAECIFGESCDFKNAIFLGDSRFLQTRFGSQASFRNSVFLRRANFQGAYFEGGAIFEDCVFSEDAQFSGAYFGGLIEFSRSKFFKPAYFWSTTFNNVANFNYCEFSEFHCGHAIIKERMELSGAQIFQITSFEGAKISCDLEIKNSSLFGQFEFTPEYVDGKLQLNGTSGLTVTDESLFGIPFESVVCESGACATVFPSSLARRTGSGSKRWSRLATPLKSMSGARASYC